MQFLPIKTRKFLPPRDDLFGLLNDYLPKLKEKDILVITSKIVSISQGRTVKINKNTDRIALIKQEADAYLPNNPSSLTIKDHTLIPYAGIDRSNGSGHYVLWPKNPPSAAKAIWKYLRRRHKIKQLGIIITDSFCLPLRWGHMGISIGFFGFNPIYSYEGKKDIFNRKLIRTNSNLVDSLSALAVVHMGEGNEQTPLCLVRGFTKINFDQKDHQSEFFISPADDLYTPLLTNLSNPH